MGGGGDHKNTIEFKGGEEDFTAAQIKLQKFTTMWRNDIEETEEDDFILTLGSISSGDRHLLTVLLTTSSNMKWTKLVFKKTKQTNKLSRNSSLTNADTS